MLKLAEIDEFLSSTIESTSPSSGLCPIKALTALGQTIHNDHSICHQNSRSEVQRSSCQAIKQPRLQTIFPLSQPASEMAMSGRLVRCLGMVQDLSDTPMLLQSRASSYFSGIVDPESLSHPAGELTQLIEAHQVYLVPIPGSDYAFIRDNGGEAGSVALETSSTKATSTTGARRRDREENGGEDDDEADHIGGSQLPQPQPNIRGGSRPDVPVTAVSTKNPMQFQGALVRPDHTGDGGGGILNFPTAPVCADLSYGCVATYLAPSLVNQVSSTPTDNSEPSNTTLKINQIVECIGFIVPSPEDNNNRASNSLEDEGGDNDRVDDGVGEREEEEGRARSRYIVDFGFGDGAGANYGDVDDEEDGFALRYERLPHGLAPRLICVSVKAIDHPKQLPTPDTSSHSLSPSANKYSQQWCSETRAELLTYLTNHVTHGDSLLAEYLLLHLVSSVDFWHGGSHVPVGDVPMRVLSPNVSKILVDDKGDYAKNVTAFSLQLARHLHAKLRPLNSFGASLLNLTKGLLGSPSFASPAHPSSSIRALERGHGGNFLVPTTPSVPPDTNEDAPNALFDYGADQPYPGPTSNAAIPPVATKSLMPYKDNKDNAIVAAPLQIPSHHHIIIAVSGDSQDVLGAVATPTTNASQPAVAGNIDGNQGRQPAVPNANNTSEDDLLTLIHKQHTFVDYVICKIDQPVDVRCLVVAPVEDGEGSSTSFPPVVRSPLKDSKGNTIHDDLLTIAPLRLACTVVWEPRCIQPADALEHDTVKGGAAFESESAVWPPAEVLRLLEGRVDPSMVPMLAKASPQELLMVLHQLGVDPEIMQRLSQQIIPSDRNAIKVINEQLKFVDCQSNSPTPQEIESIDRFKAFIDYARRPLKESDNGAAKNSSTTKKDDDQNEEELLVIDGEDDSQAEQDHLKLQREAKQTEETLLNELVEWQRLEPELFNHDALLHNNTLSVVMSLCRAYARSFGRLPRSLGAEEIAKGADRPSMIHDVLHDFYQVQKLERARYLRGKRYGHSPL